MWRDFQVFIIASFPASFMFLLVALTSFRKPHLNMLREATVAHAPRAHFDPCRSEGLFFFIPRLSESWKPCPARCLETRLLPVSHPAVTSGDRIGSLGLEFDLECFRTPVEGKKNRELTVVIELLHPSRHPRALYTLLPLKPKHQGVTWNLSMCLTDVGSFLHDFKKPGVQLRDLFHCVSDTRLSDCSPSLGRYPQCCILWWGESIKTLCTPGARSCLQHQPLIFLFFSLSLSQRKKLHIRSVVL